MFKRDSKLLLSDIISSVAKIKSYTEKYTFETFIVDSHFLDFPECISP